MRACDGQSIFQVSAVATPGQRSWPGPLRTLDQAMMMTCDSDIHTLARHRILAAMDEIVARFVYHAEHFQRLDDAAPALVTEQITDQVSAVGLALARYRQGEYEAAACLAGDVDPNARGG